VAQIDPPGRDIHANEEQLRDDHVWINKLARYLEGDPLVEAEVLEHASRCRVCNNVITVWKKGRDTRKFLMWVREPDGKAGTAVLSTPDKAG
jgi:hypothetical protein